MNRNSRWDNPNYVQTFSERIKTASYRNFEELTPDILNYITLSEPDEKILKDICNIFSSFDDDYLMRIVPRELIYEILKVHNASPSFLNMLAIKLYELSFRKKTFYSCLDGGYSTYLEETESVDGALVTFFCDILKRNVTTLEVKKMLLSFPCADVQYEMIMSESDPEFLGTIIDRCGHFLYREILTIPILTRNQLNEIFESNRSAIARDPISLGLILRHDNLDPNLKSRVDSLYYDSFGLFYADPRGFTYANQDLLRRYDEYQALYDSHIQKCKKDCTSRKKM